MELPGAAFTGLMLCAIGIEGMSAPTVMRAPESGGVRRMMQS